MCRTPEPDSPDAETDFLVSQGVSAHDVRTVRLTDGDEQRPVSDEPTPRPVPPPVPRSPAGSPRRPPRVLMIEDDEVVGTAIGMVLSRRGGYQVSHALDGSTGLREAYAQRPDLVLLDIMLPGIDGTESRCYVACAASVTSR
ncbi:response regulator [Streptomyces sp. MCAF7]